MIIIYIVILPWVFTSIFLEDYHRYFDRTARENFISFFFFFFFFTLNLLTFYSGHLIAEKLALIMFIYR